MSSAAAPAFLAEFPSVERVSWKRADGSDVPGYAVGPKGAPAVVAIQEWWGIDKDILDRANKLAAHGFRVVTPDLYRGKLGVEAEEAHHLMEGLDWAGAVDDIRSAAAFLKSEGSGKVGVTGFCMGGALTVAAAVKCAPEVDAAAPFYGYNAGLADASQAKVPVQAHFGAEDKMAGFSSPADAAALEEKLKASGQEAVVYIYPGVGHAFMNETPEGVARRSKLGQGEHNAEQVALAFGRLVDFFKAKLA